MQRHILIKRVDPDLKQTGMATVSDETHLSDKIMGTLVIGHIFGVDIMLLKPPTSLPTITNSKYQQTCHNFFRK